MLFRIEVVYFAQRLPPIAVRAVTVRSHVEGTSDSTTSAEDKTMHAILLKQAIAVHPYPTTRKQEPSKNRFW